MSISVAPFTDLAAAEVKHLGEQVRTAARRTEAQCKMTGPEPM